MAAASRLRRIAALLAATAVSAVAVAAAVADQVRVDGDTASAGLDNPVALTAVAGATVELDAGLSIDWSGSRHLVAGSSVVFAVDPARTTLPAGYSVSATEALAIPAGSGWDGSEDSSGTVVSRISFSAPATPGSYAYEIKWSAQRTCASAQDCLNSPALRIELTVVAAPPDTAPSQPGQPVATAALSADGVLDLGWSESNDAEGDPLSYSLERRSAVPASAFAPVASGLAAASHSFTAAAPEAEGTWVYRVRALAGPLLSPYSAESAQVKVDRSAPHAPTLTAPAPDFAGGGGWYRDTVSVAVSDAGDPDLADGSAGSGVDPGSFPPAIDRSTSGAHALAQTVRDHAGHESAPAALTVQVDADPPTGTITCPQTVAQGSAATASYSAADAESGLAGAPSGTVPLDTSAVGTRTARVTVADNVGHEAGGECAYEVVASPAAGGGGADAPSGPSAPLEPLEPGDATPPSVTGLAAASRCVRDARLGGGAPGRRDVAFTYELSEAADVELSIQRRVTERAPRTRCPRARQRFRSTPPTAFDVYEEVGRVSSPGGPGGNRDVVGNAAAARRTAPVRIFRGKGVAGRNRIALSRLVSAQAPLAPGLHRLVVTATDAAGNRSEQAIVRFWVIR